MKYEIVNLKEKTTIGISARTNNNSPDMAKVIGGLWTDFYQKGIYESINGKVNQKALGIYSNYTQEEKGDYSITVACEVKGDSEAPKNTVKTSIPAGKYAKFVVKGHMQKAVADFWQELWQMDLPRSFVCDFEEYQSAEVENAEIHIYIGLK